PLKRSAGRRRAAKLRPPWPGSGSGARGWGFLALFDRCVRSRPAVDGWPGRRRRLGERQIVKRLQAEHLKEANCRAEESGLARTGPAADLFDEVAQLQVRDDAVGVDAADLLDLGPRHGLLVGDDRQGLVSGGR